MKNSSRQKISLVLCFFLLIFLTNCAKSTPPSPSPTSTSQPTPTIDPYLAKPSTTILQETDLYSGPGNLDFDRIATLSVGAKVYLLGTFIDFAKVYDPSSQQEGFVFTGALKEIPDDLAALTKEDVPWVEVDYIADSCNGPFTQFSEDGKVTITDYVEGPGNFGLNGVPIELGEETEIIFDFTADPNAFWISLTDQVFRPFDNENWMLGYRKIGIYRNNFGYEGYQLEFRDGKTDDAILFPLDKVGNNPFKIIFLDPRGRIFEIRDLSDNVLYRFNAYDIAYDEKHIENEWGFFPNGSLVVSCADVGPTKGTFNQHSLFKTPSGIWQEPEEALPNLRALAQENGIDFITFNEPTRMGNRLYAERYKDQTSIIYINEMSVVGGFWTGINQYNFGYLDNLFAYYKSQGYKVLSDIAYGRVKSSAIPPDLYNSQLSKEEYTEIFHDYVSTLTCRYADQVDYWQIASESLGDGDGVANDFWGMRVGPEYVSMAFQLVHECDPDAVLLIVDTIDSKRDEDLSVRLENNYQSVKKMIQNGVPIDAVGFEGHLFVSWDSQVVPKKQDIIDSMRRFGDLGVDVYITEMDVDLGRISGSEEEKLEFQASMYKMYLDACLEAGNCKGFGVFVIDDPHSWLMCPDQIDGLCPPPVNPEPLLYDVEYKPKPAFWALVESLQEH